MLQPFTGTLWVPEFVRVSKAAAVNEEEAILHYEGSASTKSRRY